LIFIQILMTIAQYDFLNYFNIWESPIASYV
jgi:hypothetical protein